MGGGGVGNATASYLWLTQEVVWSHTLLWGLLTPAFLWANGNSSGNESLLTKTVIVSESLVRVHKIQGPVSYTWTCLFGKSSYWTIKWAAPMQGLKVISILSVTLSNPEGVLKISRYWSIKHFFAVRNRQCFQFHPGWTWWSVDLSISQYLYDDRKESGGEGEGDEKTCILNFGLKTNPV